MASILRKIRAKVISLAILRRFELNYRTQFRCQHKHAASDISKLLEEIPDLQFYALRLGKSGCSVGRPNYNSFNSGYIDIDRIIGEKPDSLLCTSLKTLFSESVHNIQRGHDPVKKYDTAISVLDNFLETKDFHEDCIIKGIELAGDNMNVAKTRGNIQIPETTFAVLLAVHLLSRLITDGKVVTYAVSNEYREKPDNCPCKMCDSNVVYASTLIGSEDLFIGRPDIILFPNNDEEQVFNIVYPAKPTFSEAEWRKTQQYLEEKSNEKSSSFDTIFDREAVETLTFSFYHRTHWEKKHQFYGYIMKSALVPTVAICDKGFSICMYDSVNDIFLKNLGPPVPLFDPSGKSLRISSVVYLWLLINHSLFQPRLSEKAVNNMKGSFGLLSTEFVNDDKYERIKDTMHLDIDVENNLFNRFKQWEEDSIQLPMEDNKRGDILM